MGITRCYQESSKRRGETRALSASSWCIAPFQFTKAGLYAPPHKRSSVPRKRWRSNRPPPVLTYFQGPIFSLSFRSNFFSFSVEQRRVISKRYHIFIIYLFISPNIEINITWPPKDIKFFDPIEIPLLNSFILVSSGFTVTLSHYYLIINNLKLRKSYLLLTILLGIYFTILQTIEYSNSFFCFNDSIYGSIFFIATGFHGLHVLIGSIFLLISLYRIINIHFSNIHNINFELAIWYWHFVDVIWLFLYTFIYLLI